MLLPCPVGSVAEDADTRAEHLEHQRLRQVLELARPAASGHSPQHPSLSSPSNRRQS
jgi:hypothetical protein